SAFRAGQSIRIEWSLIPNSNLLAEDLFPTPLILQYGLKSILWGIRMWRLIRLRCIKRFLHHRSAGIRNIELAFSLFLKKSEIAMDMEVGSRDIYQRPCIFLNIIWPLLYKLTPTILLK